MSGAKAWPACDSRAAWIDEQIAGDIAHRPFGLGFGFGPARAAQGVERRARLAGADVFADQVRLGHRHVEFGRRLGRVAWARIR